MIKRVGDVARLDLDRETRTGIPEAVLAEGKTDRHLRDVIRAFVEGNGRVIVTRLEPSRLTVIDGLDVEVEYHEDARVLVASRPGSPRRPRTGGLVGILAAGTADVAVAEETRVVLEELGCEVLTAYDVGVAGIHRLYPELDRMSDVDVLIAVAGREGALAPVVAGLAHCPVIGLPVSVGYGHAGRGEAALSTMLQSCAPLTVVNIDAGFVAAAAAAQIANRVARMRAAGAPGKGAAARPEGDAAKRFEHHGGQAEHRAGR